MTLSINIVHIHRCQKNNFFTECFGNDLSHVIQFKANRKCAWPPSLLLCLAVFGLFVSLCLFKARLTDSSETVTDRSLILYENYKTEVLWRCMQQKVKSLHAFFPSLHPP